MANQAQYTAVVLPVDATDPSVTWSVEDGTGQATIDSSGLLTAVAAGTVTVVATANDGSGVYGEKAVSIVIKVTDITIEGDDIVELEP